MKINATPNFEHAMPELMKMLPDGAAEEQLQKIQALARSLEEKYKAKEKKFKQRLEAQKTELRQREQEFKQKEDAQTKADLEKLRSELKITNEKLAAHSQRRTNTGLPCKGCSC